MSKMKMKITNLIWTLVIALAVCSCNNTKYLPANESLYIGAEVKVQAPGLKKKK